MSDYIDRENTVSALKFKCKGLTARGGKTAAEIIERYAIRLIENKIRLPSAPVREVVQGRWDIKAYGCYCSVCGTGSNMPYWNFCPNCGADMRGPVANIDVGRKEKGGQT